MPQTVEAINHAKAAGVPIIVAVNKIDKPSTNLDRLFSQLAEHGIQSEEWGGENQFVKTSALQRIGIDELLDAILLKAEVLDLKASHSGPATGAVVEAHLDKGRGPVATIMVQTGTLKLGQYVVAGREFGRVRAMIDHRGLKVDTAGPSTPVEVVGLGGVPGAGDRVNMVADERTAREVVAIREEQERKKHVGKSSAASLADLLAKVQTSERPELAIIIKADVQGSLEAVCEAINKLSGDKVRNRIIHRAVGGISESDLSLAMTTGAVIIGFNVRAARGLDDTADKNGIVIRYFSIIYELVDAVKAIMAGKLPPIVTENVLGHAEVRQTISVPKIGTIAGSAVLDGKITRQSKLRLIRNSVVIYNGKISSLRRFKDDVREVAQGYECGIGIDGYADIRVGDVIEAYELQESAPTL
jgi:translation initiation factor IF-2